MTHPLADSRQLQNHLGYRGGFSHLSTRLPFVIVTGMVLRFATTFLLEVVANNPNCFKYSFGIMPKQKKPISKRMDCSGLKFAEHKGIKVVKK